MSVHAPDKYIILAPHLRESDCLLCASSSPLTFLKIKGSTNIFYNYNGVQKTEATSENIAR